MGMESKAASRLGQVSPRRHRGFSLSFRREEQKRGVGATPPFVSAPSSPLKHLRVVEEVDVNSESLLPACHVEGSVPFKWEEKPGTPKSPLSPLALPWNSPPDGDVGGEEQEGGAGEAEGVKVDFDFSSAAIEEEVENDEVCKGGYGAAGDELFSRGHILPLKPPPRLQSQLLAARHLMLKAEESVAGSVDGSMPSAQKSSPAPASLGQAVGLTTVSGRGARSASVSPVHRLFSFCGLSSKGARRGVHLIKNGGGEDARLSYSDVYLMCGLDNGASTDVSFASSRPASCSSSSSLHVEERGVRSAGSSADFDTLKGLRLGDSNLASADCNLGAAIGTPLHRKDKSFCKDKGFFFGLRNGKEELGAGKGRKLFKDAEGAGRGSRSLSPLGGTLFRRGDKAKRVPAPPLLPLLPAHEDKDGFSFHSHGSWGGDDKEREELRPLGGVAKKLVGGSTNKAWDDLKGLTLNELLEDGRDRAAAAAARHTDSPASNSSSGSFGVGSFGSFSSSNSGSVAEATADQPQWTRGETKPGRHTTSNAMSPRKGLLTKPQGVVPDCEALKPDHYPLYRRYETEPLDWKQESPGKLKGLLHSRTGILSCLGCSTKSYQAFGGISGVAS